MIWLNQTNGADKFITEYCTNLLERVQDKPIMGAVLGSAYGGEVEFLAKLWKDKGTIYGFDTFEGHPKHLAENQNEFEATCMDDWYSPDVHGTNDLGYEVQRLSLDRQGLDNAILVKGEVNKDSLKDVPYLHYALLDMDIYGSMKAGYEAVKDKVLHGYSLFLHDCVTKTHLPRLYDLLHDEIMPGGMWRIKQEVERSFLTELERI